MDKHTHILSSRFVSKRFVCATIYPNEDKTVVRFYIRHDFLRMHNGSCNVQRTEVLGEIGFKNEDFRPGKSRRLYDVTVEGTSLGGERDG